jgi:WD40 repeat protein
VLAVVLGFAAVSAALVHAVAGWDRADANEREAVRARNEARRGQDAARRQAAELLLDRGLALAEQGEVAPGLYLMLDSLRTAPEDAADLRRVVRINLAAWAGHVRTLRQVVSHEAAVNDVAFSPDGKTLAVACEDGSVHLWDAATGGRLGQPLRHPDKVIAVAFSPDGKTLVAGCGGPVGVSRPRSAQVWDVVAGAPRGPPLVHRGDVNAVAFTPDGKVFLTESGNYQTLKREPGEVRRWDAVTLRPLGEPLAHEFRVNSLAVSPDGKTLLTGTGNWFIPDKGEAQLWDLARGEKLGPPLVSGWFLAWVSFHPGGKQVLLDQPGRKIEFWDLAGRRPAVALRARRQVGLIRFLADGQMLVTGRPDGVLEFWDVATGEALGSPLAQEAGLAALAVSPDGKALLVGSRDRTARLWELPRDAGWATGGRVPVGWNRGLALRAAVGPNARRVATAVPGGGCRLWEVDAGSSNLRPPTGELLPHPDAQCVAFSADGCLLATGSGDGSARLWQVPARSQRQRAGEPLKSRLLHTWPGKPGMQVTALAFNPDGKWLAVGGHQRTVCLWDTATGQAVGAPLRQHDIVLSLAFHPGGKALVVGTAISISRAPTGRVWDLTTRQPVGAPMAHTDNVHRVAFSPDGRTVVTASEDQTARLWDAATGRPLSPRLQHRQGVPCVLFSPDGKWLLTGGGDGTVRLWDAATGEQAGAALHHPHAIVSAAFSPNSRMVLVGSTDGRARLWDVATRKPLGPPVDYRPPILGVAFLDHDRSFLTIPREGPPSVWDTPTPLEGTPDQFARQLEVRAALRMEGGQPVALDAAAWRECRRVLEQVGAGPTARD